MSKEKTVEPVPREFRSYAEAVEFWDEHDTTDYPEVFRTVKVVSEFRRRHYEIDGDVAFKLRQRAHRAACRPGASRVISCAKNSTAN